MSTLLQSFRRLMAPSTDENISSRCQRTQSLSIWEGSLWAAMWGLGESYIAPFALFLGAGNLLMAFVGTGPVLITALAQLAGAAFLDRVGRRKPIIYVGMVVQSLIFIPLFLLPLLLPAGGTALFNAVRHRCSPDARSRHTTEFAVE